MTPTMSRWCSTAPALCSARRRRADDAGSPSPRRRQEAPQSGGVKPLRVAQPVGRGATRSRPLPASMASGVDLIAAPGGTFGHGASGNAAGGLRAPQTPARYLNKEISRPFDGSLYPQTDRSFKVSALQNPSSS